MRLSSNDIRISNIVVILIIFVLALGIRLHYLGLYEKECPLFANPLHGGDPLVYTEWSMEMLRGNMAGIDKPVYTAFCALARLCSRDFFYGIRMVQAVMGAFSCVLIYFLGKVLMGKIAGVISAGIGACYSPFVFYTAEILGVTLHVFLFILISLCVAIAESKGKPGYWLPAGFLMGLLSLDRGNALFLIPFCIVWIFLRHRSSIKRAFTSAASLTAGIILLYCVFHIAYFSAESNFHVRRVPVLLHLYRGNAAGATGKYAALNEVESIHENETALSALRRQIRQAPARWIRLLLCKSFYTVSDYEIPNNVSFEYTRHRIPFLRHLLDFGIIAPFGFMGFISFRKKKAFQIQVLLVLFWMITLVIFFVTSRYRMPAVGVLIVSAGCYISSLWEFFRLPVKRWKPAAMNAVGLVAFFIITNLPVDRTDWVAPHRWGVGYMATGNLDSAEKCLMESVSIDPTVASSYNNLGFVYRRKNMIEKSVECHKKAIALAPDYYLYYKSLGMTYYHFGRTKEALDNFRISYGINPDQPRLRELFEK